MSSKVPTERKARKKPYAKLKVKKEEEDSETKKTDEATWGRLLYFRKKGVDQAAQCMTQWAHMQQNKDKHTALAIETAKLTSCINQTIAHSVVLGNMHKPAVYRHITGKEPSEDVMMYLKEMEKIGNELMPAVNTTIDSVKKIHNEVTKVLSIPVMTIQLAISS